jgi:Immunity protein Imm1
MTVEGIDSIVRVEGVDDLRRHLKQVRRGLCGVFILTRDRSRASLWLHINDQIAYLHFLPDEHGRHAGFQPTNMTPADCPESVRFLLPGGADSDAIDLPRSTLVAVDVAYVAAEEYFQADALPPSIQWLEL